MKQHRRLACLAAVALASWMLATGCGATSILPPPASDGGVEAGGPNDCDPTKCAPGNQCLSDGKETRCRLVCATNEDGTGGQAACPLNYHCVTAKPLAYCAPDKTTYAKSEKGQWGAACLAAGGLAKNEACDVDQDFWCYGVSPVDATPFCTQFQCTDDSDCRGGWWCATTNVAPNVERKGRSVGDVTTVCLPRGYCSTCATDIDCPTVKSVRQYCVDDTAGSKYCAPACSSDANCNSEATCAQNDAAGLSVCQPRAGVCRGDGSLCSPCQSDKDCPQGVCAGSPYSTERYCTVKSTIPCTADANGRLTAMCPKTNIANVPVSCATKDGKSDPSLPKDQCFGLVSFGTGTNKGNVPGCFTKVR